jgi:hypothetical protein
MEFIHYNSGVVLSFLIALLVLCLYLCLGLPSDSFLRILLLK